MSAVITGVGSVSALGIGQPALLSGLTAGKKNVGPIKSFDATTFPTKVAGEVPILSVNAAEIDTLLGGITGPEQIADWDNAGVFRDRKVIFGLLAAAEAWRSAGCDEQERDASLSIALGLEHCFLDDFSAIYRDNKLDWSRDPQASLPSIRYRSTVDLTARCIEQMLLLRGRSAVHASACAAGGMAIAYAASLVNRNLASVVLAGGSDSMVNPLGIGGMSRIGAPSPRNTPDACRPFDRRRDGLAIGEGAAMFVVESEERALSRGASPICRILGWATTQDAYRATAPRPEASATRKAMEKAIARAGLPSSAIGYVCAHGTGTTLNDPAEALAIRGALGRHAEHVPVSSIKGAVGHLMAASGALELAACMLPFQHNLLPGTANHLELSPDCEIDVIGETPRAAEVDALISNSFGFGGQNVSLVLGRFN